MKQSVYFLHIPRTSGVFVGREVSAYSKLNNKNFLSGHSDNIQIKDFEDKDYVYGHYALTPIPYLSKTFTILRDPVERCFSYMKHIWKHFYFHMSIEDAFDFFLKDKDFKTKLSNQQSYFLTSEINMEEYNKNINDEFHHVLSGWNLIKKDINKESVIESIDKNNIEICFFEDKNIYNKVFDILQLTNIKDINFDKKKNESVQTKLNFYDKYYNEIYEINKIDIEVYNFLKNRGNSDFR